MAECQHWLLYSQLQAGIRFLDVRCRHYRNGLPIHHGIKYQHADFPMVLREIVRFLIDYPTETIVMRIKKEFQSAENNRPFEETFQASVQQYIGDGRIWSCFSSIPILGDIRGKIVILQDFRGSAYGLDYNSDMFSIEDHWKVPTILDLHIGHKWQHVKRKLDTSGEDEGSSGKLDFTNTLTNYFRVPIVWYCAYCALKCIFPGICNSVTPVVTIGTVPIVLSPISDPLTKMLIGPV